MTLTLEQLEERVRLAQTLFAAGYNCCQAVIGAYADCFGMEQKQALLVSAGMGGGMGRLREVCGAVSGMSLLAGLRYGDVEQLSPQSRSVCYNAVQQMARRFREQNGSIVCKELLGIDADGNPVPTDRRDPAFAKRPCKEYVAMAARIAGETL